MCWAVRNLMESGGGCFSYLWALRLLPSLVVLEVEERNASGDATGLYFEMNQKYEP